jgi:hypothetical protein
VSLRDTLLQLGFVLIAGGAVFATWALLTGPLSRFTRAGTDDATPVTADDPRIGSSEEPT